MTIKSLEPPSRDSPPGSPIHLMLTNTGETPALDVRAFGRARPIEGSQRPAFASEVEPLPAQGMYGPGVEMPLVFKMPPIPVGTTLYVYGHIEYADILGNDHWTEFCASYLPQTNSFTWCGEHNGVGTQSHASATPTDPKK